MEVFVIHSIKSCGFVRQCGTIHYKNSTKSIFLIFLYLEKYGDMIFFSSGIVVSMVLKYADNIVKILLITTTRP